MAITIVDIANMAGVSVATVSRALNNNGGVSQSTLEQINSVIEQNNFKPLRVHKKKDKELKKARQSKDYNFAMVWSGGIGASTGITAQEIMHGLSEAARQFNAAINIEFIPQSGDASDILSRKHIDGFFLSGSGFSDAFIDKIKHFPIIWLLQSGLHEVGDRVQPDHAQVGLISYKYLTQKGCTNLCCISCQDYDFYHRYWKTREQAFQNAAYIGKTQCNMVYLDFNDRVSAPVEVRKKAAQEAVEKIRSLEKLPDGIFVANSLGLPLYAELTANGIIPGRDVELIAGDKEICGDYSTPEAVKIDIGAQGIGQMATEAMIWRLRHPQMQQVTYMLKPSLIIPANNHTLFS